MAVFNLPGHFPRASFLRHTAVLWYLTLSHSKCTWACPRSEDPDEFFSVFLFGDIYFTVNLHAHPHQFSTPGRHFSSQYFSEHSRGEMVGGAASDRQTSLWEDKTDFFSANVHVEEKDFVPFLSPVVSERNWVTKEPNVAKDLLLGMWGNMKSKPWEIRRMASN